MKPGRLPFLWIVAALLGVGCVPDPGGGLPSRANAPAPGGYVLAWRIAHVTDTHMVDIASPARFAGADGLVDPAWRPQEAYATQILDGVVRTVNRIHASGRRIDFLLHTGDGCDNAQSNELAWLLGVLEGETIVPLSMPDDRALEARPPAELDPFAGFEAQGLYVQGRHGELPSIPWYGLLGNHDVYSIGVFPTFEVEPGHRIAPLPLEWRPGIWLPVWLDPIGALGYGQVTPAATGPPRLLQSPRPAVPNPARAYFDKAQFAGALAGTVSTPAGHGLPPSETGQTWYSVSPAPGLRLIGLDTTTPTAVWPGSIQAEGALSREQLEFLAAELAAAAERGELVVVASHHPSDSLVPLAGSDVRPEELRAVLAAAPGVMLHLAGHTHRNRVWQRAGYLEIETCSTIDMPQEGRLIEIWRNPADGGVAMVYEMFSHLEDDLPPLGADPLRGLREVAFALAAADKGAYARRMSQHATAGAAIDDGLPAAGRPDDRDGTIILAPGARR
ncbi:MAG: metallophosphoesterase [Planctomycetota bacterium]